MEPTLESNMPLISLQSIDETRNILLKNGKPCPQSKKLVSQKQVRYIIEDGDSFSGSFQTSQIKKQQVLRERKRPSSTVWHLSLITGDVILLLTLFGLLLFFHPISQALSIWNEKLIWLCLALVSWGLAVNMTQAQDPGYASSRFESPCKILFALLLMNIFWVVLSYLLSIGFTFSAWLQLFFLGLAVPTFTTWRFFLAEIMNLPRFRPRSVIVGVNPAGETVAQELQSAKDRSPHILGYIDESVEEGSYQNGLPVLGGRDALHYLVYNRMVDKIIVALDYRSNIELFKEVIEASNLGISVLPMPVVYESCTGKVPVEHVGDHWYVVLWSEQVLSLLYLCWKKALDIICGFCGLVLLCLILPIIALLISLDSSGPVFYSQKRVGLGGKPFCIYKFRSMHTDAEQNGSAVWATQNDARVTRVGRFMRAIHLDELPQMLNILRGDMSLIGPRPEREELAIELEKKIPFYRSRLAIKPGLTGWAQVKYHYASSDEDTLIKLQYDLYYLKHQSFMMDIFIILMTFSEVFLHRGT